MGSLGKVFPPIEAVNEFAGFVKHSFERLSEPGPHFQTIFGARPDTLYLRRTSQAKTRKRAKITPLALPYNKGLVEGLPRSHGLQHLGGIHRRLVFQHLVSPNQTRINGPHSDLVYSLVLQDRNSLARVFNLV